MGFKGALAAFPIHYLLSDFVVLGHSHLHGTKHVSGQGVKPVPGCQLLVLLLQWSQVVMGASVRPAPEFRH